MTLRMNGRVTKAVIAAVALTIAMPAYAAEMQMSAKAAEPPVRSQSTRGEARPLQWSAVIQKAADEHGGLLEQPAPRRRSSCVKGLLTGTGLGALIGAGSAVGLLLASGGSDSANAIIHGHTAMGAGLGFMIGSRHCGQ